MGDFNVACGVSRISMGGGEPCVLIPLVAADDGCLEMYEGSMWITNEGPKGLYVPFTLPIFGEYNHYGELENIERDCNVEAIEKFFGVSIEVFQAAVNRPFDSDNTDAITSDKFPKKPLGMYVHRKVYDAMAKKLVGEFRYKSEETSWNSTYITSWFLREVGFVEGEKHPNNQERYNRSFRHPAIPGLIMWSDDTWVRPEVAGKKMDNYGIYNPEGFVKFLKEHKLPVPQVVYDKFKNRSLYDATYDMERSKMSKNMGRREVMIKELMAIGKTKEEAEQSASIFYDLNFMHTMFRFGSRYANKDYFAQMYNHLFDDPKFKHLVVGFKTFEHGLYGVNAPYMPSWNGMQYGNDNATRQLAEVVGEIMKERSKEDRKQRWWDWRWSIKYHTTQWFKKKLGIKDKPDPEDEGDEDEQED